VFLEIDRLSRSGELCLFYKQDGDCGKTPSRRLNLGRITISLRRWANAIMPIGPDVLVFISATRALLQALNYHTLNEEERAELECCLRDLNALLPPDRKRHAA
jgi:hypothetical protein